jgi:hypothetical protein
MSVGSILQTTTLLSSLPFWKSSFSLTLINFQNINNNVALFVDNNNNIILTTNIYSLLQNSPPINSVNPFTIGTIKSISGSNLDNIFLIATQTGLYKNYSPYQTLNGKFTSWYFSKITQIYLSNGQLSTTTISYDNVSVSNSGKYAIFISGTSVFYSSDYLLTFFEITSTITWSNGIINDMGTIILSSLTGTFTISLLSYSYKNRYIYSNTLYGSSNYSYQWSISNGNGTPSNLISVTPSTSFSTITNLITVMPSTFFNTTVSFLKIALIHLDTP